MATKKRRLKSKHGFGISRIDQPEKNNHGFYVRLQRAKVKFSAYFSDKKHGGKASAHKAAQAAVNKYLRKIPPATKVNLLAKDKTPHQTRSSSGEAALIKLLVEKHQLEISLKEVDDQIRQRIKQLEFTGASRSRSSRAPYGQLRGLVLACLGGAGRSGMTVPEIAQSLGRKSTGLHVWFSTKGKTIKGLSKIARGRFAYLGDAKTPTKLSKRAKKTPRSGPRP